MATSPEKQKTSQPETEIHPSLGTIIEALHESEINGSVSWFWGVVLCNSHKGIEAEATVYSSQEAAMALRAVLAVVKGMEDFADRRSSFGAAGRQIALKPLSYAMAGSRDFHEAAAVLLHRDWSRLNPEKLGPSAGETNRHVTRQSRGSRASG